MAHDTKRKADRAVQSLLQTCEQAATAPKVTPDPSRAVSDVASASERTSDSQAAVPDAPRLRTLRRHITGVVIPSAGPCEGLSQFSEDAEPLSARRAEQAQETTEDVQQPFAEAEPQQSATGQAGMVESADPSQQRLSEMHSALGCGEGVTQLVRASICDLEGGGTGIVSTSAPAEAAEAAGAAECFSATVDFFDRLCSSASTLIPVSPHRRQSTLRTRLELINERLHSPEMQGRVCVRLAASKRAS